MMRWLPGEIGKDRHKFWLRYIPATQYALCDGSYWDPTSKQGLLAALLHLERSPIFSRSMYASGLVSRSRCARY